MKQNVVGISSFLLRSVFSLKLRTPLKTFWGYGERQLLGFFIVRVFWSFYKRREVPPLELFLVIWNLGFT
jgi:hypothetical protein